MELTHFDEQGNAHMVDVGTKEVTDREAVAIGKIAVNEAAWEGIRNGSMKKGDVLGVARIAGIMAAKKTSELIPLCHILPISHCSIDFEYLEQKRMISCTCTVRVSGKTGVEMEALTGVNIALLTIYDMCKAVDKEMQIGDIRLLQKTGGKSGWIRNERQDIIWE